MMTYKYKFYRSKRTLKLDAMLREACFVWNHALALQKRYYSLFGGYINASRMQKHFAKRVNRTFLYSQTTQEIIKRLDNSYKRFFEHKSRRPPRFRKERDFSSIVYWRGGYKLNGNILVINIINQHFKFAYSRPYSGNVRQIRIKRNRVGDFYLYITTDATSDYYAYRKSHNGASVGMDFGLKTFLTLSNGSRIENPLFLKSSINELRRKSKALSRTELGSNHHRKRLKDLSLYYERTHNLRNDWQWKVCHDLCRKFDTICIEDLNLSGMAMIWGRKVNDIAFGGFVKKLGHVASKYGTELIKIDRYYPSSKTCSLCQHINEKLSLRDRDWICPKCGAHHDRDFNASINILRQGIASSGSAHKTVLARQGALATGESVAI